MDLNLVKKAQKGDAAARQEIELQLQGIRKKVINQVCGKVAPGFIDQPLGRPGAYIESFGLDNYDNAEVYNKSLVYALETYKHDKGKKFSSWFYDVFYGRLYNLKSKYIKQYCDGLTLRKFEQYQEVAKNILGSPVDENIIKQETSFNNELMESMSDQEKKYCALMLSFFKRYIKLTDETAGQVLGVSRRQVLRYKASLKNKLESMPGAWSWPKPAVDELPDLINECGAKDPTPREAAKRIRADVTLNCMKGESINNRKGLNDEKL